MIWRKFKHLLKMGLQRLVPAFYRKYAYAQAGEDVVLDFLLNEIGLHKPTYLEIGVFDPILGSNTYKFYERGARGVLVEADETQLPWIQFTRPHDRVLHCGVSALGASGGPASEAEFFIFDAKGINTFSRADADERLKSGKYRLEKTSRVKLRSINDIIRSEFKTRPDFLSIDIEGLDLQVLQSLDFKSFPIPILCVETCAYSENHIKPKNDQIVQFLTGNGYMVYADTYINTLFVNRDWFYGLKTPNSGPGARPSS